MTPREALIEILAGAEDDAPGLAECLIQDLAERGLVLVPREATAGQIAACRAKCEDAGEMTIRERYTAMVDAASE